MNPEVMNPAVLGEDAELLANDFVAGLTASDMVKMKTADFLRLANGTAADFGKHV